MALRKEFKSQGDFLFKNRSYIPIIAVLFALYLYMTGQNIEEFSFFGLDVYAYEIVCFIICILGLLIRVLAVGYSSDNTSGRNTTVGQKADSINRTGLYSLFRHPLYIGNYFMWIGIAAFTQDFWFLVAFTFWYMLYYERIMYAEEEFLISTYGQDYLDFSAETPAILPRFKHWTKPTNSFSFIKIIRQEKTGILNLFLVIFIFKLARYLYMEDPIEMRWIYGLGVGIVWYILVKVLQKTTNVLEFDR